jgi:hypothetical protein
MNVDFDSIKEALKDFGKKNREMYGMPRIKNLAVQIQLPINLSLSWTMKIAKTKAI